MSIVSGRIVMSWASAIASRIRLLTISVTRLAALLMWPIWALMLSGDSAAVPTISVSISVRPRMTASGLRRSWATVPRISLLKAFARCSRVHCAESRALAWVSSRVRWRTRSSRRGVGLLQLLVEDDVVERDRKPAREDLDERAVGVGEPLRGFEQHDELAPAAGADVEHRAPRQELMVAAAERFLDDGAQLVVEPVDARQADEAAVAAGAREHREAVLGLGAVAQHQDPGAVDIEQRGDLGEHAFGEALHRLEVVERRGGVDDDLEAAPGLHHALQLLIAAQRRGERGEQLVGGELGLRLVVVDVVVDDDAPLRGLARLAGAQDDAHGLVLEGVADVLDEVEPGLVGLHDDVEQHRRGVGMRLHQLAALLRREGGEDFQPVSVKLVVAEREARAVVDGEVVVDHRDLPERSGLRRLRRRRR